jgi:protein SCO1
MISLSRYLWLCCLAIAVAACSPSKPTFKGTDVTGVQWGQDITLQSQTGKPASTADFRGKLVVVFFGYSHCPDICTPTLAKLAALRKTLGNEAQAVQVVFVTVDPAHDTPEQLAGFLPKFDPTFVGLTGKPEEIAAAAKEYKIAYVPASGHGHPQVDHGSAILVKDAAGKLRLLWKNDISIEDMAHDVKLLLKQQA